MINKDIEIIGYGSEKTIDQVLEEQRKKDNYKFQKYFKYIILFFIILPISLVFTYCLLTNKSGFQDFILEKIKKYFNLIVIVCLSLFGMDRFLKKTPIKDWILKVWKKFNP